MDYEGKHFKYEDKIYFIGESCRKKILNIKSEKAHRVYLLDDNNNKTKDWIISKADIEANLNQKYWTLIPYYGNKN